MIQCDMHDECGMAVTHIGSKGYVYCTAHALQRQTGSSSENVRKMQAWELRWLGEGKALPSYKPGPEPK